MSKDNYEALPQLGTFRFQRDPAVEEGLIVIEDDGSAHSPPTWNLVNPLEVPMKRFGGMRQEQLFAFQFGAIGTTRCLVWARSLEDGLEEVAGWLKKFAPGIFHDDEYMKELYEDAKKELGPDAEEDEIQERAEADLTYTESGYIPSDEWWVDDAHGPLWEAGEYASKALYVASYHNFDMTPALPLGKGAGAPIELDEEDVLKMFADADLGLTAADVQKIAALDEEQTIDLKAFKLERVG